MANVKTTLTLETDGQTTTTFSNTKKYTEETITKFYVNASDSFSDLMQFSPSDDAPTKTSTVAGAPSSFCIYNSGNTGVEIMLSGAGFTDANVLATGTDHFQSFILGSGEMFFSNTMRIVECADATSVAFGATSALKNATSCVETALSTTSARGADMGMNTNGSHAADATTLTVTDGTECFRVGDYLYVDATNPDVVQIVSIDTETTATMRRGVLGYTAQTLQTAKDIYMYAGTHLHDKNTSEDDSGVKIRTDRAGMFKGQLLGTSGAVPRGNDLDAECAGVVPGSVSIQFPLHGAYRELGLSISARESSGLSTGTAYAFRIQNSLATTADIEFTTDTSDVSYGKVVSLINQALVDGGHIDFKCEIINGDIRFTSKKMLENDTLTLLDDADGSNEPWAVGNIPDTANHEACVPTTFPQLTITDNKSGKAVKNTQNMLVDDGNGNLVGTIGSGTIDYDSGRITMKGPFRSEFKTSFAFNSAHAGSPRSGTHTSNMVISIKGRSCTPNSNGEITLISYS